MESSTKILRRLLDERGVEYETDDTQVSDTEWYYVTKLRDGCHDRWIYEEPPDCDLLVSYQYDLGAEDAIAATLGSCNCSDSERTSDSDATGERQRVAVEVVRCRDCKFYTPESMTREERGFGVYENVWEPGGCFNPERCSHGGDPFGEWYVVGIDTEPDGFCAWGVRMEDA